jgi:hypothetical protein
LTLKKQNRIDQIKGRVASSLFLKIICGGEIQQSFLLSLLLARKIEVAQISPLHFVSLRPQT